MKLQRRGGPQFEIELISTSPGKVRVRIDGREVEVELELLADDSAMISVGGRRTRVAARRRRDSILIAAGPAGFEFVEVADRPRDTTHGLVTPEISASMPGKVLKVMVREGDHVVAGQPLIVLEAMKMETTLTAESSAHVKRVLVSAGDAVEHGAVLIELSPARDPSDREPDHRAS
ncbi:MAG: biotin/lipoyl-binding protein [Candidatus Binataceae bacterium]|nr:biotin/lipoyl-binding protein [Candidatus Binataceae bacterium]